jgi:hypothetical protein
VNSDSLSESDKDKIRAYLSKEDWEVAYIDISYHDTAFQGIFDSLVESNGAVIIVSYN